MASRNRAALEALLDGMGRARIGLVGDLCLDVYWKADMRLSELSRETPHYPLPVVEERVSPGGAGNVACNLAALAPGGLKVLGLVGEDWRGELLIRALEERGVDTGLVVRNGAVCTNAYIKPLRAGISDVVYEDPRIDFENRAPVAPALEAAVLEGLERLAEESDALLVSDQLRFGCVTDAVRRRLCALGESGKTVIVDSRSRIGEYRHVIVKPNEVEAARAFGGGEDYGRLALAASRHTGRPAVVTAGSLGCYVARDGAVEHVPGERVAPPIDIVGAGDTFLAALGMAVAAGGDLCAAALAANLASSVTIRKLGTTGTATREEILAAFDRGQKF